VPTAAVDRDLAVPKMELRSETIEFDFMHPFLAARRPAYIGGQARYYVGWVIRPGADDRIASPFELMRTASFRVAASPWTASVGLPAGPDSFFQFASSRGCSGAYSSKV